MYVCVHFTCTCMCFCKKLLEAFPVSDRAHASQDANAKMDPPLATHAQRNAKLGMQREDGNWQAVCCLLGTVQLVISKKEKDEKLRCQEEASLYDCADYR